MAPASRAKANLVVVTQVRSEGKGAKQDHPTDRDERCERSSGPNKRGEKELLSLIGPRGGQVLAPR